MSELVTPETINAAVAESFPGTSNNCIELGDDWVLARVVPGEGAIRPGGYISGPTQFGLADAALWYATFVAIGRIELMALTSELSIRYLRPAIGDELWARAELESVGSKRIVGSVRLWTTDPDRPTSVAQGTYQLPS
ncbi:MAG: PaaI family thioesterase [Acidimicrobiales bacterium]